MQNPQIEKIIHGQNPQLLIEKILRARIYESQYWKEKCFALTAETLVDRAVELQSIGGHFANQKPTEFICLVLKLLQLSPEPEITLLYLENDEFKYLRALGAFYIRMTFSSLLIYQYLEPLLNDKSKLRIRSQDGSYKLTFMDEFVDDLLNNDRVCDTILPRITKRHVLEDYGDLEPRISVLHDELLESEHESFESSDDEDTNQPQLQPIINQDSNIPTKKEWSKKKVNSLFKKQKSVKETKSNDVSKGSEKSKDSGADSLSIEETNKLRISLGLKPLNI